MAILWAYLAVYLAGILVCYWTVPNPGPKPPAPVPAPTSLAVTSSEACSSPAPALPPSACHCPSQSPAARLPQLRCTDDLAYMRDAPAPKTAILARCALQWMAANAKTLFNTTKASLFDPAYDGLHHPLVNATSSEWLHLTALLPQPGIPLPKRQIVPYQQVVLAPTSAHRLSALLVTNSLFDVFLALRLEELLQLKGTPDLLSLLGRLVAMAKQTFVILPCSRQHAGALRGGGKAVIKAAVAKAMAQAKQMGVLYMDVVVKPLVLLSFGGCTRQLLHVHPTKLHRGVRLKWCYYPLGPKYDLVYRDQEWVQLVHRYVIQYTRAAGDKVKSIRKWKPSMNLADVLGWGIGRPRREVILYDMLRIGSCPDPAVQNWLLTSGGLAERIDANQQMIPNAHPEGRSYIQFLQLLTCTDRWANQTWKQVDVYEGLAHETQTEPLMRFIHTKLFAKSGNSWSEYRFPDPITSNEHPDCPECNVCLNHKFHITKMFRHNNNSLPPPECHACWRCKRDKLLGPGIPLDMDVEGCTDVEGVDGRSAVRPEYCDETQEQPIMRPSTRLLRDRFVTKGLKPRPEMLGE